MNEHFIQEKIWKHFLNHTYRFLNIQFFGTNEIADFLSFQSSGYCVEVEVKCTRYDFKADFKKPKHKIMMGYITETEKNMIANRFYFAVPKNLIKLEEIPKYAGLIYIGEYGSVEIVKKAPLIHRKKNDYKNAFNKMYYTYEKQLEERFSIDNTNYF